MYNVTINNMEVLYMHECLLCKRDMSKAKDTFGKGCINNIYKFLNINAAVKLKNKEKFLYQNIMDETKYTKLNNKQKIWLTDRYLTYRYLDSLKYGDFTKLKKSISLDIENIKGVQKEADLKSLEKVTLKESYDLYKRENKFKKKIKELLDSKLVENWDSKTKLLLASFSFIFNMQTNKKQYEQDAIKEMQYAFWQTVIEVGGRYVGFKFSAELLKHSLEEKPNDLYITDGKIIDDINEDNSFKKQIKEIIKNNINKCKITLKGEHVQFDNSDLYFSIHGGTMHVSAIKKHDNIWDISVHITDKYDYTKWKNFDDYYFDANSVLKSIFSSTLYNLAFISTKLGVVKEYCVDIKFKIENYKVEE